MTEVSFESRLMQTISMDLVRYMSVQFDGKVCVEEAMNNQHLTEIDLPQAALDG